MDSLSILLLLLIKDRILVLGHHLLLSGHLSVPPLHGLGRQTAIPLQRSADRVHDAVDGTETLALSCLLGTGEPPGDFPIQEQLVIMLCGFFTVVRFCDEAICSIEVSLQNGDTGEGTTGRTYQRRPPNSGDVGLNIVQAVPTDRREKSLGLFREADPKGSSF